MTGAGVFAGASNPTQPSIAYPGTPDSAIVGRSGSTAERLPAVIATARSFPDLTCGIAEGAVANETDVSLPITLTIAGPPPLYDTLIMSLFVISLNCSTARWLLVPTPG